MPPSLTAATGMDALTHAIEAFVSRFHTPVSDMYCLEAVRRIGRSLRAACRVGSDSGTGDGAFGAGRGLKASGSSSSGDRALLEARSDMALAATLAGVGLSQAGLGMVHGFAHPVGAMAGLAHGLANAILLPFVMEALIPDAGERLSAIGEALTGKRGTRAQEAVRAIARLGRDIGIPENLEAANVPEAFFEEILADALSYRRRKASPRAFTDDELRGLLARMYSGKVEA